MKPLLVGLWIVLFALTSSPVARSQQEPVNGYYDAQNDWFVFEWIEEGHGKLRGVLDPSNKVKPVIHASVSFDASSKTYGYAYQVTNQTGAVQLLDNIFISHPAPIFDATLPEQNKEWDMGEYRNKGLWNWSKTMGTIRGIPAGQSVNGFSFKSKGLPGIVDAKFSGERRVRFTFPGDDASPEVDASYERVYAKLKDQYPEKFSVDVVKLKTIGPIDPPKVFDAATFITNLISLKDQAKVHNWIKNDGILKSLEAKLSTVQKKIATGDNKAAKNLLGAFVNEVKAQNGKHLTSEAYALLYFNARYAMDHL